MQINNKLQVDKRLNSVYGSLTVNIKLFLHFRQRLGGGGYLLQNIRIYFF